MRPFLLTDDRVLQKFVRQIAKHNKQVRAQQIVEEAFYILKSRHGVTQ